MKIKRKIILAFCMAALLLVTSLAATILYYYYNPSKIKALVEKSVSRYTKGSFAIKKLSYSINPLRIRAEGIIFKPLETGSGLHLEIPALMADMVLEGRFGHRSLVFKALKIDGFSLKINKEMTLPKISPMPEVSSFFSRALKGVIAFFFFRDIKFQAAELNNGHIMARSGDQTIRVRGIHAKLTPDHLIEITSSVKMESPFHKVSITAPYVHVTTDHAVSLVDPDIKYQITIKKSSFQGPDVDARHVELKTTLIYEHKNKKLAFEPMDLQFGGIILKKGAERESIPVNLHLKIKGIFNLLDNHLDAPDFYLSADDTIKLKGKLHVGLGPPASIGLEILNCSLLPEKVPHLLPAKFQDMLTPFRISGAIRLKGDIRGIKDSKKWSWQSKLEAHLNKNQFSYSTEQIRLNGRVTGKIKAEGELPDIKVSVKIRGDETVLSGKGAEFKAFNTNLSLAGKRPVFEIEDLTALMPQVKFTVGKREILIDDIRLHIREGSMDVEKKSLSLPEIQIDSALVKNLRVALEFDGKQVVMQLRGKDAHLIESALALNLLPAGWQFSGLNSIQIRTVLKDQRYLSFHSELGFRELGFENQDGSFVGEKISISANSTGDIDLRGSLLASNTTVEVHGGEFLYDRFYLDLNMNPFFSTFRGKYDMSKMTLQLLGLRLGLKDILTIHMAGTLYHEASDQRIHLSLNIPKTSLSPAFHHFILEPFKTEKPFLTGLNIGGNISADLILEGNKKDWVVKGRYTWQDGEISSAEKDFSFEGIFLDLPVWIKSPVTSNEGREARNEHIKGGLSIKSMALPMLPGQSLTIPLEAGPNRLSVRSPTIVKVPGGKVRVGPIASSNIFTPKPSISTSITLKDIDIRPLLSRIWTRTLKGSIYGRLDPIFFKGNTFGSHGQIMAKVSGGEIIVSDLGASGIFTSTPVFKLNARWKDLNLADLTKDTSFGKIEGILKGNLNDLEIAYGQPQRFDLLLETEKKRGVPQKISVRALDNIARIGGGQSPFIGLAGTFAIFFKEFPYKKIGVHASLENDVFKINGTIKEGGLEYLVKRGGFSGVNVVNQNPDNRISFKDMVKRIKRITASKGGPIVK